MINTISTLWSNSIEAIEKHFNYTFSDEIKQYVKNKRIRCCSRQINFNLDEEYLTLCFNPHENLGIPYQETINIIIKGESKLFKLWQYGETNYCMAYNEIQR